MSERMPTGAGGVDKPRIVVGLDGSPGSERAVSWTAATFAGTTTEVLALHALRPLLELFRDLPPTGMGLWRQELRGRLQRTWCEPLRQAGIRHRAVVAEDAPAAALSRIAEKEHAQLIVIGECHHPVAERLRGGIAGQLAHHGRVPVVVVPLTWAPAGAERDLLGV